MRNANLLKLERGLWVVACDGRKAVILENTGNVHYPRFEVRETHQHNAARTKELGTDAPGRVHASVGTARSAVEQTDWHEAEETAFLKAVLDKLAAAILAGKTRSLIIVAPPRSLGVIRKAYPEPVRRAVQAEIDKDLAGLPPHDIQAHLVGGALSR